MFTRYHFDIQTAMDEDSAQELNSIKWILIRFHGFIDNYTIYPIQRNLYINIFIVFDSVKIPKSFSLSCCCFCYFLVPGAHKFVISFVQFDIYSGNIELKFYPLCNQKAQNIQMNWIMCVVCCVHLCAVCMDYTTKT